MNEKNLGKLQKLIIFINAMFKSYRTEDVLKMLEKIIENINDDATRIYIFSVINEIKDKQKQKK